MKILATIATVLAAVAFTSVSHAQTTSGSNTTYFPVKLTGLLEFQGSNSKVVSIPITTAKIIAAEVILSGSGSSPKEFALLSDTNNNVSVIRTTGSNSGEIIAPILSGSGTPSSTLTSRAKTNVTTTMFTVAGKTISTPQTRNDAGTANLSYTIKTNPLGAITKTTATFFGGSTATSGTGTLILPITTVPSGVAYLVKGSYKTSAKAVILPTPVTSGTDVLPVIP